MSAHPAAQYQETDVPANAAVPGHAETPSGRLIVHLAIAGNALVALSKFVAAALTGSSAMWSEGVHSLADLANELLLLYGLRRADAPATPDHPFGHGREVYFWSFIVALMVFVVGASVSFLEGLAHWRHPHPIGHPFANYVVLGASFVFEGVSWIAALRAVRGTKGALGYFEAMRRSKDPTVFTVLLEDSAALIGLAIAFAGITLAAYTGEPRFDAAASLLIAALLAGTSYFLARETKGLLIGEPAHPHVQKLLLDIAQQDLAVRHANGVVTAQLGPDHVLVALSAEFEDGMRSDDIEASVQRIEHAIAAQRSDIVGVFVKPQSQATWTERRAALASPDVPPP
jgi:cation diffusion facilitator family transporter